MAEYPPAPATPKTHPTKIPALVASTLGDFRHALKPLLVFEGVLKGVLAVFGLLGTAYVVAPLIERTGRAAVTNKDIASFLLSPSGLAAAFLLVFGALFASVIEHVGVMVIVAMQLQQRRVTPEKTFVALASVFTRLIRFQLKALGAVVLVSAPFVVLAGLAYLALLNQHDINFYLTKRPPSFYAAVGIGGILALGLSIVLLRLFVQGIFVIPSLVIANLDAWSAVKNSRSLASGAFWRIAGLLVGWHLIGMLLGILLVWGFTRSAGFLLGYFAAWPWTLVPLVGFLLTADALVLLLLSTLLVAVESILILRLYYERTGTPMRAIGAEPDAEPAGILTAAAGITLKQARRFWAVTGLILTVGLGMLLAGLGRRLDAHPKVTVAAHRGYSHVAPENTLSAVRKAFEVGADYAEIDVQETRDGKLVIIHDRDLMRMAKDPRRVADLTLAELKMIDVGSIFSPEFEGERVPTLDEVIELARGKIGLQIELKYYGPDGGMAEKVAERLELLKFEPECVVISLDYGALLKAKARNPKIKTAAIVTYALGDIGRLDVDALSVHTSMIDRRLLRTARSHGKDVYAWTVNDPHRMVSLIEQGVTSLVTDVPSLAVSIRRQMDGMSDVERRILSARYLLGLEPELEDPADEAAPGPPIADD